MSQDTYEEFDQDDDGDPGEAPPQGGRNPVRERMTKLEKREREATARADAAERKLAFVEAGVPISDPRAKYFLGGYDGELTAAAIKAAAAEIGLIESQEPPGQDAAPADEQAAHKRMSALAAGGQSGQGRDWDAEILASPSKNAMLAIAREREVAGQ